MSRTNPGPNDMAANSCDGVVVLIAELPTTVANSTNQVVRRTGALSGSIQRIGFHNEFAGMLLRGELGDLSVM